MCLKEGDNEYGKVQLPNAILLYTEGLKLKCSDDQLNAELYTNRARAHFCLGEDFFFDLLHDVFSPLLTSGSDEALVTTEDPRMNCVFSQRLFNSLKSLSSNGCFKSYNFTVYK